MNTKGWIIDHLHAPGDFIFLLVGYGNLQGYDTGSGLYS